MYKNRPKIDNYSAGIIKLFNRCDQTKCLPKAGGMLDQDEKMMTFFDIIRKEYAEWEKLQAKRGKVLDELDKQLKGNHG